MSGQRNAGTQCSNDCGLRVNSADRAGANQSRTYWSNERMDRVPDAVDPLNLDRQKLNYKKNNGGYQHVRTG